MTKSQANNYSGVRKKLMGAVAMLLVASIMVVSSTYAWFTLSTAPEITGISTSVGANGNLEIALLNGTEVDFNAITSAVGDSSEVKAVTLANITWGNLVDLSDASYGTANFVLNPARLNLSGDNIQTDAFLQTAKYGADGRVSELAANTRSAVFNDGNFKTAGYGVRAVGVAGGMSPEQLAFRTQQYTVYEKIAGARNNVTTALTANGGDLVNLALKFQDNANYAATPTDLDPVNAVIAKVNAAYTNLGEAILAAKKADALSHNAGTDALADIALEEGSNEVNASEIEKAEYAYSQMGWPDEGIPVATAETLQARLQDLINTANVTVCGAPISEPSQIASNYMSNASAGIVAELTAENAGYISKIANMAGSISASIVIPELSVGDIEARNVSATLKKTVNAPALNALQTAVRAMAEPTVAVDSATASLITDFYGYAIDFALRTNASGSSLKLQTEEAQRIYNGGSNSLTQGGGSYMQFTKADDLSNEQFTKLLGAIRVVFMDTQTGEIHTVAVLDTAHTEVTSDGTKAPLKLTAFNIVTSEGADKGKITIDSENDAPESIMDLAQNTPVALTALVYLDGDVVDNSMVSATVAKSMTGTMNLQFASSAELQPMVYTPLNTPALSNEP